MYKIKNKKNNFLKYLVTGWVVASETKKGLFGPDSVPPNPLQNLLSTKVIESEEKVTF